MTRRHAARARAGFPEADLGVIAAIVEEKALEAKRLEEMANSPMLSPTASISSASVVHVSPKSSARGRGRGLSRGRSSMHDVMQMARSTQAQMAALPDRGVYPGLEGLSATPPAKSVEGKSGQIYSSTSVGCLKPHHQPRRFAIDLVESGARAAA